MSDVEAAACAKLQSLRNDSIAFCLLNALLANAPTVEGVEVIATDITNASEQSDGLDQLAEFYKTGLLLPVCSPCLSSPSCSQHYVVKAGGRMAPQVSFHPSRDPEIKSEANAIAIDLGTAKRDPTTLKKYVRLGSHLLCILPTISYLLESSPGWLSLCGNASVGLFVAFTSLCEGKI